MKTIAKTSCLILAWMAAGMTASAQWNVITEPLPPPQPAPGLRRPPPPPPPPPHHPQHETPRRWMPPREPGRDSVHRPPPHYTPRTQLPPPPREPVVVRPLGSQQPERRPNPPRRRPDDRDVERQIRERDAYGYSYDYGGRGVPPAGHYDLRGGRDYDMLGRRGRDVVVVRDEVRREPPRREVRYPKGAVVVATLNAGREAKEVVVNRQITRCYLELVSGTVSINTVVVRPEKTQLLQTVRLQEGKLHMIDLGGKRAVSGFRISDNGRGVYRVIVQ